MRRAGVFMQIRVTFTFLILLSSLVLDGVAQTLDIGRINGRIIDGSGKPVAGVVVSVQEKATGALVRSASTSERGEFAAPPVVGDRGGMTNDQ